MLRWPVVVMILACAPAAITAEDQSSPPPSDGGTHQCERGKGEAQKKARSHDRRVGSLGKPRRAHS